MAEATSKGKVITLAGTTQAGEARGVGESLWTLALRRVRRDRLTMIAISILAFLTIMSVSAPLFARALNMDPDKVGDGDTTFLRPFQQGHILGTDDLGRDHFLRLLYAGQISLGIAFTASILAISLGIALGVWAGYYGGIIDDFMTWVRTTPESVPSLYLLLLLASLFRP